MRHEIIIVLNTTSCVDYGGGSVREKEKKGEKKMRKAKRRKNKTKTELRREKEEGDRVLSKTCVK